MNSNFDIFNTALKNLEKVESAKCKKRRPKSSCNHDRIDRANGVETCVNCGEILTTTISHDREWRHYANSGKKNPARVQIRKIEERSIFKDVTGLGFSNRIVSIANDLYQDVSKGSIFRGNCRKAIIFACIFHAYKSVGQPKTHEKLIRLFKLTRKSGLKGLKHVTLNSNSPILKTGHITAEHLIKEIMTSFKASDEQKAEVQELYRKIKNRSSSLNRARPNSVASGLVFFWIQQKGIPITLKEFAKSCSLSDITITKISKEIEQVLQKKRRARTSSK